MERYTQRGSAVNIAGNGTGSCVAASSSTTPARPVNELCRPHASYPRPSSFNITERADWHAAGAPPQGLVRSQQYATAFINGVDVRLRNLVMNERRQQRRSRNQGLSQEP